MKNDSIRYPNLTRFGYLFESVSALPEVIFCDIGLPDMDGFEIVRCIRKDHSLEKVYIVALTGYAGKWNVEKAKESGFDRHLAKPADIDAVKRILCDYIINQHSQKKHLPE